jgi:hypothetical protein
MKPLLCSLLLLWTCAGPAAAALRLESYPLSHELVLGTVPVEVQPARFQKVKAPLSGPLHLRLPAAGTRLAQGALWAEFDPARGELERAAFDLARELLAEKEIPQFRLDQSRTRAELADKLGELERQSALLAKIVREARARRALPRRGGPRGRTRPGPLPAHAARTAGPAAAHRPRLHRHPAAGGTRARRAPSETQPAGTRTPAPRGREPAHDAVCGRDCPDPPAPPDGEPLAVEAGMDLAWLQDFSQLNLRVPVRRAEWRLLPAAQLTVRLDTGATGPRVTAAFFRSLTEEVHGREELVYYFTLAADQSTPARALVGGQLSAQLITALVEPARLVPKLDLVLADPAAFRAGGWAGGLATLLPGARSSAWAKPTSPSSPHEPARPRHRRHHLPRRELRLQRHGCAP